MQAFYWNCPSVEHREYKWWVHVQEHLAYLKSVGFTALWLPPACKGANIGGMSMGYDPYDYYDLGEYDQKGSIPTWFGTKAELVGLIKEAHQNDLAVYADLVINHNSGGDEQEVNPLITGENNLRWTKFTPKSNKFLRDWTCFHPSIYEKNDQATFGDMIDLCHRNPDVYKGFMDYSRWLIEEIGFDGFRYDFVKGFGPWIVHAIHNALYPAKAPNFSPFAVGECWDKETLITEWLDEVNHDLNKSACAFDFNLRDRLKGLCDSYGYSLRKLAKPGVLTFDRPMEAVTFVENHDTEREGAIIKDKMLAYAVILTHEGYPCIFWKDYFNWNLAQKGTPNGIEALVELHERYAGGSTNVLYEDDNVYIMERTGHENQPGLILVINNYGNSWNGHQVKTLRPNTKFVPAAWWSGISNRTPQDKQTDADGKADFWGPPRGYVVYIPDNK